ncbi:hypothetical protein NL676_017442 [Syzygium grande]|nr:hypothetical protein NL676_017442 [Syzygium grande]
MDPAHFLRQRFYAFVPAQNAWNLNRFNPELTQQERQEYYESFVAAQNALVVSMDYVRLHELLVLSSISQARAFTVLDPRKDISKKRKRGTSSSAPAVLERPPPPAFAIFMCDFKKSKECESVEKSPFAKEASEMVAAFDRAVEFYKMITNAPKATAAAAPPTEEKLSEAATTNGPME